MKWTKPKIKKLKSFMEQGLILEDLSYVKKGEVTAKAIENAGHRFHKFGVHKVGTNQHMFTSSRKFEQNRCKKPIQELQVGSIDKAKPLPSEGLQLGFNDAVIMANVFMSAIKKSRLKSIIDALATVGQNNLAHDLRYCTS